MKTKKQANVNILKNPITILASIVIAIFLGILGSKGNINVPTDQRSIFDWIGTLVTVFSPLGDMYLNMLRMTIYPILIAAIVSSIAGLVKSPVIGKYLTRMLVFFGFMLLLTAALGTFAGIIGRPGAGLSEEARATLGKSIERSEYKVDIEISLTETELPEMKSTFIDFIVNLVPRNVFKSLVDELALQLVIFSIFFGIAAGIIKGERGDYIKTVFEGFFSAFQKIISWLMYLLPFGLIFLIAGQISSSQKFFEVLSAMIRFIVIFYIVGIILIAINTVFIWKRSKEKLSLVLKEQLDPIIIALATRSSFATLPSAMKALTQKLGFYESTTKLYIPLGITLGRFGNVLYFALATMFVSQLYSEPMTLGNLLIVLIGSIFAGTATAGATGLTTLSLMSIVLAPMGLPIDAVLILFMTIDTIIDPLRTLLIVHSNMAVDALVAGKAPRRDRRHTLRSTEEPITSISSMNKIQSRGEIIAAIRNDDIPIFHSRTRDGHYQGLDIDFAKEIAEEFEVNLRIDNSAKSEDDLINLLTNQKADFAISRLHLSPAIKENLCVTNPYISFHRSLLINKNFIKDGRLESLYSHCGKVGVCRHSNLANGTSKLFPESEIIKFDTYDDMVKSLAYDEMEMAVGCKLDILYSIRKLANAEQKNLEIITFRSSEDSCIIALPKEYEAFIYIFNKVIQQSTINSDTESIISQYGNIT